MYSGLKYFKISFAVDFHLWSGDGTKRLMHILGIWNETGRKRQDLCLERSRLTIVNLSRVKIPKDGQGYCPWKLVMMRLSRSNAQCTNWVVFSEIVVSMICSVPQV